MILSKKDLKRYILEDQKYNNGYLTYLPLNCFEEGLSIAHLSGIYINNAKKFGEYCRFSRITTIGFANDSSKRPQFGDFIFVGPNCSIIVGISIASDACVAAGSVIAKSIEENGTTWVGVSAIKISDNNSRSNIPYFREEK